MKIYPLNLTWIEYSFVWFLEYFTLYKIVNRWKSINNIFSGFRVDELLFFWNNPPLPPKNAKPNHSSLPLLYGFIFIWQNVHISLKNQGNELWITHFKNVYELSVRDTYFNLYMFSRVVLCCNLKKTPMFQLCTYCIYVY